MAIDKNPQVGRIVLLAPYDHYNGLCSEGGKITKLSKSRIYYEDRHGSESFVLKFAAVCDTAAEAQSLLRYDREYTREQQALRTRYQSGWKQILSGGVNTSGPSPTPPVEEETE